MAQGSKYSDEQVAALKGAIVARIEKGTPVCHAIETAAKEEKLPLVHSGTVWRWRKKDAAFDARMQDAIMTSTQRLMDIGRGAAITHILGQPHKVSAGTWIFCMVNLARQLRSGDPYDWESVNNRVVISEGADSKPLGEVTIHNVNHAPNGKEEPSS